MIARGDLVCVVMAYQGGGRYGNDGAEGVYTVLRISAALPCYGGPPDAWLARGDQRRDLPDPGEWDVAVTVGRCAPFSAIGGVR